MSEYHAKKQRMLEYLGGVCALCGTGNDLEIDHINASEKQFDVSKNWARKWSDLVIELNKCQLLCEPHHIAKSKTTGVLGGEPVNKIHNPQHGTAVMYGSHHKCRCDKYKLWKKLYRAKLVDSLGNPQAVAQVV